ncbi:type 4 pilus major pilin [Paraburkholderia acidisoli]|uniref:Type 4 secretion system PilS N-terminal domain-containing protein n=1 Tax=Paraburkholderia acidisoli TaxID=2571748 RepID=A0A7Z2GS64_9BURK|nr:type 4 pilus major pilin [Paraburkholderia acidisoli]QGZ66973.1 hypothetical protein FAZ98_34630 [Paraburkholderia acidisoli]
MNTKQRSLAQAEAARRLARRKKQAGELSLIEAGAVLGAAALLALVAYLAVPFVRSMVQSAHFKSEAAMFHTGIQNATQNDADFSAETLGSLAENHAFDAAGTRLSADKSAVQGLFGGDVTAEPGTVNNANDAVVVSYPVPTSVCSMSVSALANVFPELAVNGTTVFSPTTAFSSATAGTACASAGEVATVEMYTTRG